MEQTPGLFGLSNSNRDFSKSNSWGKNQFNNSFPAALISYMHFRRIEPVYIVLDNNLNTIHKNISVPDLFGIDPTNSRLYYAFERDYSPFQKFVEGTLPRVDLVTMDNSTGNCLRGIEIKLTALPDNSTHLLMEQSYGSELVVRPDTIVYLGISIATHFERRRKDLLEILRPSCDKITDWSSIIDVLPHIPEMINALDTVLLEQISSQMPLVMQPIWKTDGKSPILSEHCLDTFVWSDYAFTRLFIDITKESYQSEGITRIMRTSVWLVKMLYDFARYGKIDHRKIIDEQSYNTKNDKAFALSGMRTHLYMSSNELTKPRIKRDEVKNIILGGGQKLLSPERRFDAVIVNTPGLFD
ncbi:HindVP family restriction endonuclease [Niallia circulans]|uniref:HindVP family restriction endonuclease n=1 Tax=Niallia circulans TaxID=1397 RepID=UPI002041EE6C|nr:HindVP family restriction endonuclease [Niallia circulans]MCM2982308.1 HindVP family restriction endonuclease [Niallia circulans]